MGAGVETAKEVKIFGLHRFLIARYRELADRYFRANRSLARRRAAWGTLLAALGTLGYYAAYGFIAWNTVRGEFSIGDLTFLAGSFRRLRQPGRRAGALPGRPVLVLRDRARDRLEAGRRAGAAADRPRLRVRERRLPLPGGGALGAARARLRAPRTAATSPTTTSPTCARTSA
jgi:hypothetical protein